MSQMETNEDEGEDVRALVDNFTKKITEKEYLLLRKCYTEKKQAELKRYKSPYRLKKCQLEERKGRVEKLKRRKSDLKKKIALIKEQAKKRFDEK
jgi:polyhydroxyalkanoate synthesis regulator phasin